MSTVKTIGTEPTKNIIASSLFLKPSLTSDAPEEFEAAGHAHTVMITDYDHCL